MLFLPVLAVLAGLMAHAIPIAAPSPAPMHLKVPWGCRNEKDAALVFRNLTSNILQTLKEHKLPATFFITPSWMLKHPDITKDALSQGHSLGLSIPNVRTLVKETETPNSDHQVLTSKLHKYLEKQVHDWNQMTGYLKIKAKPITIAFTSISFLDLRGGHMYNNRYSSLETAVASEGYTPVLAGFGADTWNEDSAIEESIALSNFYGSTYLQWTPSNTKTVKFLDSRAKLADLENITNVIDAVAFIKSDYLVNIVPLSSCLGYSVN
ncbi:hypothetical protein BDR26DRAFT_874932 [Obelidium mucronatum]|nr:hypothetical protein BDR26DRAFT_874932 [Obelidium mucronatum]